MRSCPKLTPKAFANFSPGFALKPWEPLSGLRFSYYARLIPGHCPGLELANTFGVLFTKTYPDPKALPEGQARKRERD